MQGLNARVDIIAQAQAADDSVGGSVRTDSTRYSNVRARISNVANPTLLAQQGFEGKDLHRIILYPDDYPGIIREDLVIPQGDRWEGDRFRVVEVRYSSVQQTRAHAHVQLLCERMRYAHENIRET